jgi:hypothetical protein
LFSTAERWLNKDIKKKEKNKIFFITLINYKLH